MTHVWVSARVAVRARLAAGGRGLAHLSPARHPRLWLAVLIVRAMLVTPAPFAAEAPAAAPPAAAPRHATAPQSFIADDVLIEGKLYSPQALYIVSRNLEAFDRAAIVPHYLVFEPTAGFLPYRVRADQLGRASVSPRTAANDSTAVSP